MQERYNVSGRWVAKVAKTNNFRKFFRFEKKSATKYTMQAMHSGTNGKMKRCSLWLRDEYTSRDQMRANKKILGGRRSLLVLQLRTNPMRRGASPRGPRKMVGSAFDKYQCDELIPYCEETSMMRLNLRKFQGTKVSLP
jgi:hypothetical protein